MRRATSRFLSCAAAAAWTREAAHGSADPPPPDEHTTRQLVKRWTAQEERPGYAPPSQNWPPPSRSDLATLRRAFTACGAESFDRGHHGCGEVAFQYATSLLGGTLCGHIESEREPSEEEISEGIGLMKRLAASGMPSAACGMAYILSCGILAEEDEEAAVRYHQQAASAGFAQSMQEIAIMHYLGDPLPQDAAAAVRYYRQAALLGLSQSMFMMGECLLSGEGIAQDTASALGWFAAAGELGHCSARSRIREVAERDIPVNVSSLMEEV